MTPKTWSHRNFGSLTLSPVLPGSERLTSPSLSACVFWYLHRRQAYFELHPKDLIY